MSSATASSWRLKAGSLNNLRLREDLDIGPLPSTGHHVTVEVHHCGLNFADMFACLGLYSATPEGEFTPGLEFSGVVEAVPKGEKKFKVGDRVMGVTRFGGYTDRIHADTRYLYHLPRGWTLAEGAAFPAQALTAWYGLVELGGVGPLFAPKGGERKVALIHSAAGGTGLWAAKICMHFGIRVVATVGSASKVDELCKLLPGLDRSCVIDRSACEDRGKEGIRIACQSALNAAGSPTWHLIFDSLLGDWFHISHELLAPMGRHIVLGAASMTPSGARPNFLKLAWQYLRRPLLDPLAMISTNKAVMCFNLIWLYDKIDEVSRMFDELLAVAAELGPPHVGESFPFSDAQEALARFQSGKTVGKVLLDVREEAKQKSSRSSKSASPPKKTRGTPEKRKRGEESPEEALPGRRGRK